MANIVVHKTLLTVRQQLKCILKVPELDSVSRTNIDNSFLSSSHNPEKLSLQ